MFVLDCVLTEELPRMAIILTTLKSFTMKHLKVRRQKHPSRPLPMKFV